MQSTGRNFLSDSTYFDNDVQQKRVDQICEKD